MRREGARARPRPEPDPPPGRLVVADEDDLVVVATDGSGRAVVRAEGVQFDADWSPDGSRLVYRDGIGGSDDLWIPRG